MAFATSTRRFVLNGLQIVVGHLLLTMSCSRSFRAATDSTGSALCATQRPSVVYDITQLDLPPINSEAAPPPSALCSWKCSRESDCISFNWKAATGKCELFNYVPSQCGISCNCIHYEVSVVLYNTMPHDTIKL